MKQWRYTSHLLNPQTDREHYLQSSNALSMPHWQGLTTWFWDSQSTASRPSRFCCLFSRVSYSVTICRPTYLSHGALPPSFNSLYHPAVLKLFTASLCPKTTGQLASIVNQTPEKKISRRDCLHWVGLWHMWEGSDHNEWYHFYA